MRGNIRVSQRETNYYISFFIHTLMATTYNPCSKCRYALVPQHGAKYWAESACAKGSCQRLSCFLLFPLFASSRSWWQTIEIIGSSAVLNMHISRGWPNEYWRRERMIRNMHYEIAPYRICIQINFCDYAKNTW